MSYRQIVIERPFIRACSIGQCHGNRSRIGTISTQTVDGISWPDISDPDIARYIRTVIFYGDREVRMVSGIKYAVVHHLGDRKIGIGSITGEEIIRHERWSLIRLDVSIVDRLIAQCIIQELSGDKHISRLSGN